MAQKVSVIEVAVPDRLFDPANHPRSRATVSFVGTLNHHPNEDAIDWLVRGDLAVG